MDVTLLKAKVKGWFSDDPTTAARINRMLTNLSTEKLRAVLDDVGREHETKFQIEYAKGYLKDEAGLYRTESTTAFQRFKELLDQDMIDEKVLNAAWLFFPNQIETLVNTEQATILYNKAASLPGSATKLEAKEQGLIINGDYLPNVVCKSTLVYAFLERQPKLLKLPYIPGAAKTEAERWMTIRTASKDMPRNLAGPIVLYPLKEHDGQPREGLLMPLYPATLQHMPVIRESDALVFGNQVKTGLTYMHNLKLAHCDIKPPNIFLNAEGIAHVGDYGSVRPFGAGADEKTASFVPVDASPELDVDTASAALDHCLLAVTLLERMAYLKLGQRGRQLHMADIYGALDKVSDPTLMTFLKDLLPTRDNS